MPYTIQTPSAARLKKEILDRVSAKVDADGKGIATWQCVEIAAGESVLVHTATSFKSSSIIGTLVKIGAMMMTSICLVDSRTYLSAFILYLKKVIIELVRLSLREHYCYASVFITLIKRVRYTSLPH